MNSTSKRSLRIQTSDGQELKQKSEQVFGKTQYKVQLTLRPTVWDQVEQQTYLEQLQEDKEKEKKRKKLKQMMAQILKKQMTHKEQEQRRNDLLLKKEQKVEGRRQEDVDLYNSKVQGQYRSAMRDAQKLNLSMVSNQKFLSKREKSRQRHDLKKTADDAKVAKALDLLDKIRTQRMRAELSIELLRSQREKKHQEELQRVKASKEKIKGMGDVMEVNQQRYRLQLAESQRRQDRINVAAQSSQTKNFSQNVIDKDLAQEQRVEQQRIFKRKQDDFRHEVDLLQRQLQQKELKFSLAQQKLEKQRLLKSEREARIREDLGHLGFVAQANQQYSAKLQRDKLEQEQQLREQLIAQAFEHFHENEEKRTGSADQREFILSKKYTRETSNDSTRNKYKGI